MGFLSKRHYPSDETLGVSSHRDYSYYITPAPRGQPS